MIQIYLGLVGCLESSTHIATSKGYKKISDIKKHDSILSVDNDGKLIETNNYALAYSGKLFAYVVIIGKEKIICSENHIWHIFKNGKIRECKTKNLHNEMVIKYEALLQSNRRKKPSMETTKYKSDKGTLSFRYEHGTTAKKIQCVSNAYKKKTDNDGYSNTHYERTMSYKQQVRNMDKRTAREKKFILSAWQIYKSKINNEKIFGNKNVIQATMCNMPKNEWNDFIASHKQQKHRQPNRKYNDSLPELSLSPAYVYKISKKHEMFDLIVPGTNNFIIENGIITHNSGKTCCAVRDLALNPSRKMTFSNIRTDGIKNNVLIKPEWIFQREILSTKKSGEEVCKYNVNVEFWKETIQKYKSINLILDEVHTLYDARRASTKQNKVMNDFLAMIRRVLGEDQTGYGMLTLITQLERRLDVVAKEMCTNVHYHLCHFRKRCDECYSTWNENNETAEKLFCCPVCRSYNISKDKHVIEVWHFPSMDSFVLWKYLNRGKTYHAHYFVTDIEKYFPLYKTLQWDNLLSNIY